MYPISLCPDPLRLRLEDQVLGPDCVTLTFAARATGADCPACGVRSEHLHSRYVRTLADLPWQGCPVRICLRVRRLRCRVRACPRRIFAESLPATAAPYARTTVRQTELHRAVGIAAGGEGGSRLAKRLGMPVSPDTLLRRVRAGAPGADCSSPRVLGVDEWAWRKGHRYGTILCDLERQRVVELLPDRSADRVAEWLRAHPGVEVVSRDRSGTYADAAARGAPDATQVADRWHLLRNLTEAVRGALEPRAGSLRQAAQELAREQSSAAAARCEAATAEVLPRPLPAAAHRAAENRARRRARYHEVVQLHAQGVNKMAIAKQTGLSRRTVIRWLQMGAFPELAERRGRMRRQLTAAHDDYLARRIGEGCTNAALLWRELREKGGYQGGQTTLRERVRRLQARSASKRTMPTPSALRVTWWLLADEPASEPQAYLAALYRTDTEVEQMGRLARTFRRTLRERSPDALDCWLEQADDSLLRRFVAGIRQDYDAVRAAASLPWSNGPVEGQVNRLKLLKRRMYGRASFDLLRAHVLAAA